MLSLVCHEIKNFFVRSDKDKKFGVFTIQGGVLPTSLGLQNGQYYRIIGSVFNDGVHKYGDTTDVLTDEVFEGAIWFMNVPQEFLLLVNEIEEYNAGEGKTSALSSESFGGYSYSRKEKNSWVDAYRTKLNAYRKLV